VNLGSPVHLDVEFMTATGRTKAVVTLTEEAIRPARDEEMIAVRPAGPGVACPLRLIPVSNGSSYSTGTGVSERWLELHDRGPCY